MVRLTLAEELLWIFGFDNLWKHWVTLELHF
jgi:hypothetical protein